MSLKIRPKKGTLLIAISNRQSDGLQQKKINLGIQRASCL